MNIKKTFNVPRNKGFTLIETLITVGLFVLLLGVLVVFYLGYYKSYSYIQANVEVAGSAAAVVNNVSSALKQADQIVSSKVFSGTTYTTGTSTLVVGIPSIDSSGNILSGKHDYMVFYKTGTSSVYWISQDDAASARSAFTKLLSDTTQSLTFTYDNTNLTLVTKVDVDIQTQKSVKGQNITHHIHEQTYLRNI